MRRGRRRWPRGRGSNAFIYSKDKGFGVEGKGGMILVLVVFR